MLSLPKHSSRDSQVKERLRHAGKEKRRSDVICGFQLAWLEKLL
jgi:hypothetical protein